MINKQGIILGAMELYRSQPNLRAGQCIMISTSQWHPGFTGGPVPDGYDCWNDDSKIMDYLEWANWSHDLRVLG